MAGDVDTVSDAAANDKAKETSLADFHMAEIEEYGPWIESLWEGVDCTVIEIEQKEQDSDGNDMDVEENEDNALQINHSDFNELTNYLNFRTDHNFQYPMKMNFVCMLKHTKRNGPTSLNLL